MYQKKAKKGTGVRGDKFEEIQDIQKSALFKRAPFCSEIFFFGGTVLTNFHPPKIITFLRTLYTPKTFPPKKKLKTPPQKSPKTPPPHIRAPKSTANQRRCFSSPGTNNKFSLLPGIVTILSLFLSCGPWAPRSFLFVAYLGFLVPWLGR